MGHTADQFDNVLETENIIVTEQTYRIARRPGLFELWQATMDIAGMSFDTITTKTRPAKSVYSYAEQFSKNIVAYCVQDMFRCIFT